RVKDAVQGKTRPLIVTDQGVVKAGLLEKVSQELAGAGLSAGVYEAVVPDPPLEVVAQAKAIYQERGCDSIIALGGGSSIDAAKAVNLAVNGAGTMAEYFSGRPIDASLPPLTAIPTTAGTGSEATNVAVISDLEKKFKKVLLGQALIPGTALLDPLLLASLPPRVAAETGLDALCHAVEAFVSRLSNAITDALSLAAIKIVGRHLRAMTADPADEEAAGQMMIASHMAGLAFARAGLGLAHSLAHPLGAHFHLSHGLSCSLYLPAVMDFNLPASPEKFEAVAQALGRKTEGLSTQQAGQEAAAAVRELISDLGLPTTFAQSGIKFKIEPGMIEDVLNSGPTRLNPRQADRDQIAELFEAPLGKD
ncbi:MAG: iron-containing alcohol dehydrogenase, partial [Deltaproteobacteria bacterium]|nr:iron-containing alcohol dehydrogenase [Deltaproteobacteria bacterium]